MASRLCKIVCLRSLCRLLRCVVKYRRLLLVLSLFSLCCFYIVQQYVLQTHLSSGRRRERETTGYAAQSYLNVRDFVEAVSATGSDVILIDPRLLTSILNAERTTKNRTKTSPPRSCRFLCMKGRGEDVTTVAVFESSWRRSWATRSDRFELLGFQWLELETKDTRLKVTNSNRRVSTHYFFFRLGHVVHLVLLFERPGAFLSYSRARFNENERKFLREIGFNAALLPLGEFDGALPTFQIAQVRIDNVAMLAPKYPAKLLDDIQSSRFIGCDFVRAARFYRQFARDTSDKAERFRRDVRRILAIAKRVLDGLNVPFWLSSGTCLGWFRQCDIIPYSMDVDIGLRIEDYKSQIISSFEDNGLHFHYKFGKVEDSLQLAFLWHGIKLDIYFFYTQGLLMWNGGTQARNGRKFKYLFARFKLCWTWFLDMWLRVPCDTGAYVEANYGPDWARPLTKWSWRESPSNVRENGQWPTREWDDVIQVFE